MNNNNNYGPILNNYALMLEQLKNGFISEPISEAADQQNDTGLKNVLSGKNGGAYANQWNQLIDNYESKKGVAGTYTVMIKHDNKTDMVNLQYQIGADKKPVKGSIKLAPPATTPTTTAAPAVKAVTYTDEQLQPDVTELVEYIDGTVTTDDLKQVKAILQKYVGHLGLRDDETTKVAAISRILALYYRDEGETLSSDIDSVGTSTLSNEADKLKNQLKTLLKPFKEEY